MRLGTLHRHAAVAASVLAARAPGQQRALRPSLLLVACALLAACAGTGQVADQVVKSNLAQEAADNQLLLLNIVRAYYRRPMHFTQITAIRLPIGVGNPAITIPTPFGPDFKQQIYNVSTTITVQQGVDTAVLNSQEFMRGITTPMPASVMAYYLDQGWPQQMVLHLFVRKIEVYRGKLLLEEFSNEPGIPAEFARFQKAVADMRGCEFELVAVDGKPYGPVYPAERLVDIRGMAEAKQADLALEPRGTPEAPTGWQFVRSSKSTELKTNGASTNVCVLPGGASSLTAAGTPDRPKGNTEPDKITAAFVLRSPEAMIYYLGEIARAQLDDGAPSGFPTVPIGPVHAEGYPHTKATLFEVHRGSPAGAAVRVDYEGLTYSIPQGSSTNRSMHVLSLLTQIIGLQNKGADLPSTANVRIVQ